MPRTGRFPAPNTGLPYLVFRTTPRDRYLAAMVFEHRVLTSDQIAQLAFTTLRRANRRLAELTELGIVDRTRANPAVYGSCPYLYTLGPQGALLVAAERDKSVKELRYDRAVLQRQAVRPDLPHSLGCNTVMVRLATRHRTAPDTRLRSWWGPLNSMSAWMDVIRPDAYAVTTDETNPTAAHSRFGWFFEYDTGTESINQLARKTHGYHRFSQNRPGTYPALIRVPNPAREARLHEVIAEIFPGTCPIPLATTSSDDLGAQVWRIAGDPSLPTAAHAAPRHRLAALGHAFAALGYRLMEPTDRHDQEIPAPAWDQP